MLKPSQMIIDTAMSAHYVPNGCGIPEGPETSEFLCHAMGFVYPNNKEDVRAVRELIYEETKPYGTLTNHFRHHIGTGFPTVEERMDFWLDFAARLEQEGQ